MLEKIVYVCQNCYEEHDEKKGVHQCDLCGNDYCHSCSHVGMGALLDLKICSNCHEILITLVEKRDSRPFRFFETLLGLLNKF